MTRPLTRLDKLHQRIDQEIRAETRRHPHRPAPPPGRVLDTSELLHQLGITPLDVKRWAVATGRLATIQRGRVPRLLVQAYADAHQGADAR